MVRDQHDASQIKQPNYATGNSTLGPVFTLVYKPTSKYLFVVPGTSVRWEGIGLDELSQ